MEPHEQDEFVRIELTTRLQRARGFVAQYDDGLRHYRQSIEDIRYELGKLDERLEGEAPR